MMTLKKRESAQSSFSTGYDNSDVSFPTYKIKAIKFGFVSGHKILPLALSMVHASYSTVHVRKRDGIR